jgi:DNA-binding MarR family transcriptional regulator
MDTVPSPGPPIPGPPAPTAGIAPTAEEVAAALRVAAGNLYRRLKQSPIEGEATLAETSTLGRLARNGPATSSDLARADHISPQSMGVTVAALEERGLIERSRDPLDGRRVVLSITEAGRQVVHDKRGARTAMIAAALRDGFTDTELGQLLAAAPLIQRLAEKL